MPRTLVLLSLISLSASAAILGPETPVSPPAVTPAPYQQRLAGLESNGRDFLAIWLDWRSTIETNRYIYGGATSAPLYISQIDGAGRPVNAFGSKLRDAVFNASLIWTPQGYLVLWSEK